MPSITRPVSVEEVKRVDVAVSLDAPVSSTLDRLAKQASIDPSAVIQRLVQREALRQGIISREANDRFRTRVQKLLYAEDAVLAQVDAVTVPSKAPPLPSGIRLPQQG